MAYTFPKRKTWKRWALSGFIFGVVISLFLVPDSSAGSASVQADASLLPNMMLSIVLALFALVFLGIGRTLLSRPR